MTVKVRAEVQVDRLVGAVIHSSAMSDVMPVRDCSKAPKVGSRWSTLSLLEAERELVELDRCIQNAHGVTRGRGADLKSGALTPELQRARTLKDERLHRLQVELGGEGRE